MIANEQNSVLQYGFFYHFSVEWKRDQVLPILISSRDKEKTPRNSLLYIFALNVSILLLNVEMLTITK
mgnify:CR=1 FL=1